MATLKSQHKEFIVKRLACFKKPHEVIDDVKEEFGVEVSRQQVGFYNPETKNGGRELSEEWKQLFRHTRDQFMDEAVKHPIAHKGYRLGILQKELDDLMSRPSVNYILVNNVLEQAAKEMGGVYEGKVSDDGKKPDNGITLIQQVNQIIQNNRK